MEPAEDLISRLEKALRESIISGVDDARIIWRERQELIKELSENNCHKKTKQLAETRERMKELIPPGEGA